MRSGYVVGWLALAACGCGTDQRQAELTRIDLAQFAPLPAAIVADGAERTGAQVALGRRLFYETVLSDGHDVSCNTCHSLNGYGADGRPVSFGSAGHAGGRNSPTVYNAAGHVAQFWDGRAATIELQAKGPILNPVEMAMPDSSAVLAHLRASPEYRAAFRAAFPKDRDPITYENVARAIGAFERGLVTPAAWDEYVAGDGGALSDGEIAGLTTFVRTGCSSCHNGAYMGGQAFMKLGAVVAYPALADSGRIRVTGNDADLYVFKVPSLRNVEKTGPYFHDGSVASLDVAIRLMARHQLGKELTDAQVADVRTYLASLTGKLPVDYIAQPQRM